ncbi:MAG TPA: hypothetical protein VFV92_01020 [Candidatus Bathyarchaeia archaeon]|nr:hypothetical protein [Candidatus Bathyarchaeia archaeon]
MSKTPKKKPQTAQASRTSREELVTYMAHLTQLWQFYHAMGGVVPDSINSELNIVRAELDEALGKDKEDEAG